MQFLSPSSNRLLPSCRTGLFCGVNCECKSCANLHPDLVASLRQSVLDNSDQENTDSDNSLQGAEANGEEEEEEEEGNERHEDFEEEEAEEY